MKLKIKNRRSKLVPLLLGAGAVGLVPFHSTSIEYSEDQINDQLISRETAKYLDDYGDKQIGMKLYMESKFDFHYENWLSETGLLSDVSKIINHEDFQQILSMGNTAIPFILRKIKNEPSPLVWALNILTRQNISKGERISISEAASKWYRWGIRNNYINA